jgi:hypothetical protein
MIEMALTFPILLLVLAGTLEVGKYFNDYLTLLDSTREAARFAADGDINKVRVPPDHSLGCYLPHEQQQQLDYYHVAACLLLQNTNRNGLHFDPSVDDIVISTVTVDITGHVLYRFPYSCPPPYFPPLGYPQLCDDQVATRDQGWSFCKHVTEFPDVPTPDTIDYHGPCRQAASFFSNEQIEQLLPDATPGMGMVIVEVYHVHHQFLGLIPPGLPFIPQEVVMHAYTMMPVPSAAPPIVQ